MTINSKGIMNMAALADTDKEKFNFLVNVFYLSKQTWTKNSKPVVDLYSGKIYSGMGLGYVQTNGFWDEAQYCCRSVRGSIEANLTFGSYKFRLHTITTDAEGDIIYGHKFMDCGTMDLQVLMSLYDSWNYKKREVKKENIEIQKLKKEKEELLEKVAQMEKAINNVREILRIK